MPQTSVGLLPALFICEAELDLLGHGHTQPRCDTGEKVSSGIDVLPSLLSPAEWETPV